MYRWFEPFHSGRVGIALGLIRGIMGLAFIFHGLPKVRDVAAFSEALELPFWLSAVAAWTEVIGGGLLILGLLTPLAALFLVAQMIGALAIVHIPKGDPFVSATGSSFELAAVYLVLNVALLLTGPGAYSLDAFLARRIPAIGAAAGRRRGIA